MISILKGLLAGLIISVPTGPVGFLSVKRTIKYGLWAGIITGLGAATADLFYGFIVVFGLSGAEEFFIKNQITIEIIGAGMLLMLGYATYFSHTQKFIPESNGAKTLLGKWITAFAITMTNPLQIISFGFLFGTLNIIGETKGLSILFLIGLLTGALIWWVSLAGFVFKVRNRFKPEHIIFINRIAGVIIFGSGLIIMLRAITELV